ncbi:helix-turn-helix domain-containing protein [Paenibacillus sp. FSL H8-0537]|uniref:helix-turn-helix domain-containing protein n=1 Tax=Paenibacillus sp. FSL H8-0537 TaxID=2921399 RepID=UPI0031015367
MSMLTMCVMDDIKMVVSGIAYQIPWEEHGIKIVGTAEDGQKGLEIIRELRPDIVLTDICMPKLGGCEMIRAVVEERLPTKVIFMSGFNDFAYAQEAVRLGASDYLLKPFTPAQVVKSVLKVREAIEQEQDRSDKMRLLEQEVHRNRLHQREEYLRSLLYQPQTARGELEWQEWELDQRLPSYQVLLLDSGQPAQPEHSVAMGEAMLVLLRQMLEGQGQGILLQESGQRLVVLLQSKDPAEADKTWSETKARLEESLMDPVSVGISLVHEGPEGISIAYKEAAKALNHRFYSVTPGSYSYSYVKLQEYTMTPRYAPEKEKGLLYALRSGSKVKTEHMLDELFLDWVLQNRYPDPEMMVQQFKSLSVTVYRTMLEIMSGDLTPELVERMSHIQALPLLNFAEWMREMVQFCALCCDCLQSRQHTEHSKVINQVKLYIQEHLDANLTVNSCAKAVHLSPSYLANLFKRETSLTLASYIANVRIEKAKEWLMEGMQVQQISLQLGYEDRPYFSEMFKKHCGMTPSTYRQHYFEQQDLKKR